MATFHDWNMLPPVIAEMISVMQKVTPRIFARPLKTPPLAPRVRSITHIAPPWGLSGSLVSR